MAQKPIESAITKAILLVGGKGTRLMPLTSKTPKPMLKIAGAPVTEHQIVKAREAGVTEIVLATSYLSDVFEPHFGDGSRFGIKIHYSYEREPLGTGGAIAHAASEFSLEPDESVYVFNGDVLSSHDLLAQSELHMRNSAAVTLHLVEVEDARAYGCVPLGPDGSVLDFLEKMDDPIARTINAGCYVFSNRALGTIPRDRVTSVERETFPQLLQSGSAIFGFIDQGYWIDMGTPHSMIRASRDLITNPTLSRATPLVLDQALKIGDVRIHSTAEVAHGTYLEDGVEIGSNSRVFGSIICENAVIESDVVIEDSYIAPGTRVKSGSKLRGELFGF